MNRRRIVLVATGLAITLSLTACAGGAMSEPSSTRPPFHTTTPGPVPSPSTVPSGVPTDVPAATWDALVADLAARGVTAEPTVKSSEAVTWPDGSLGCGTPGQMYTQALVDGMRIVVEADGRTYDFRFGSSDTPVLCESFVPGSLRRGATPDPRV